MEDLIDKWAELTFNEVIKKEKLTCCLIFDQIPSSRIFIRILGWQEIRQQDIRLEQYFYL